MPPSGKANVISTAAPRAAAPSSSPTRLRSATAWATAPHARKSAATGLASGQRIAMRIAAGRQPRCEANTAARAIAMPSAKDRRPLKRLIEAPAANQMTPRRARSPHSRYAIPEKSIAAAITARTPTRRGPTTDARKGKRTL